MTIIESSHSYQRLIARDTGGSKNIGGGGIAGIIIGIVIIAGILLGLLIWRLYTFRQNRDFFSGKSNLNYSTKNGARLIPEKNGHIRSTRPEGKREGMYDSEARESVLEMEGNIDRAISESHYDDNDEKRLIDQRQHLAYAIQTNERELEQRRSEQQQEEEEERFQRQQQKQQQPLKSKERYPSETNRSSWWWPSYGKNEDQIASSSSAIANVSDDQMINQDAQSEIMQQQR